MSLTKTSPPSALRPLLGALAASALLAACGGGGGGDSASSDTGTTPPAAANFEVAGVAAKGLLANALVSAHPVVNGQPDLNTTLASTSTDANGGYSLKFASTPGSLYLVRISAKADGSTTQKDEISGASQALPSGFALRALLTAEASVTKTDLYVTPFTEMAAAAAVKAGVSKDSLQQAQSNLVQMLGFDPSKVKPTDLGSAASDDEKKLAVMLTSVAQLAASGELGCGSAASAGDKVKCVVDKLAESSSVGSTKPGKLGDIDVAAKLVGAVNAVLQNPQLNKGVVDGSALNVALKNLEGDGKPAPVSDASAVTAGKTLFTELRSNLRSLLAATSSTAPSALEAEASKFETAVTGVQLPAEMLLKDASVIVGGAQLYLNFKQRGIPVASRSGYTDFFAGAPNNSAGAACSLYQDADRQVVAQTATDAKFIGCSARYGAMLFNDAQQGGKPAWAYTRHRIFLDPQSDGSFNYTARANRIVCKAGGTGICGANDAFSRSNPQTLPATDFSGKLTPKLEGNVIQSFSLAGDLPAMFRQHSAELYNPEGKSVIALSGARNVIAGNAAKAGDLETATLEGKLSLYRDNGTTLDSELAIRSGSKMVSRYVADGSPARELTELSLSVLASNGSAEFDGVFSLGAMLADKSGSVVEPTQLSLQGALRNKSGATVTEFLNGRIALTLQGFAAYDASQPLSATNSYKNVVGFAGSVTATERPLLSLTLDFSRSEAEALRDAKISGQFKTVVGGAPKLVLSFEGSEPSNPAQRSSLRISEASSGLNFSSDGKQSLIDLFKGDVKIGVIDLDNSRVTFTNGEFVSLN